MGTGSSEWEKAVSGLVQTGRTGTSGLERLAQEFFDCVGSFMPVFYRG